MSANLESYIPKAKSLLEKTPLIDGHNDWPMWIRADYGNNLDIRFDKEKKLTGHNDITRLLEGKVGGVFWSVYIDCPDEAEPDRANDFSDAFQFLPMRDTLQQIDLAHRIVERYPEHLELVHCADDILRIHRSGKIASLLGAEGLHQIGNSASVLRNYHRLGVRYVTLSHNSNNAFCDSAVKEPVHGGLSADGKRMVQEMNRCGMTVDLSHVSAKAMRDALEISKAPVMFSHSNCFALNPHPRNAPDDVLQLLKANQGILMINFVPKFLCKDPATANLNSVIDHIQHAASVMSYDHIGLGSDYDGVPKLVDGLEDVSKFPQLVAAMLARGIAEQDIEKILGLNLIRVLKGVETAAKASTVTLLEDVISIKPGTTSFYKPANIL